MELRRKKERQMPRGLLKGTTVSGWVRPCQLDVLVSLAKFGFSMMEIA